MFYDLVLEADALNRLMERFPDGVPTDLLNCIERHLNDLKQNPVAAGTRPVIPHHPSGQHFHFTCSADGTTFQMLVIFVYEQDERTLRIRSIGFRRFIL